VHLRAEAATWRRKEEEGGLAAQEQRSARAQGAHRKASERAFSLALGSEFNKMSKHLAAAETQMARWAVKFPT
jgi:hypothetical protein